MDERVAIDRVHLKENSLSHNEAVDLIDLTMTTRPRSMFHQELANMGYYVTEGRYGEINEHGEMGTTFSVFRLRDGRRTEDRVAEITTFLWDIED